MSSFTMGMKQSKHTPQPKAMNQWKERGNWVKQEWQEEQFLGWTGTMYPLDRSSHVDQQSSPISWKKSCVLYRSYEDRYMFFQETRLYLEVHRQNLYFFRLTSLWWHSANARFFSLYRRKHNYFLHKITVQQHFWSKYSLQGAPNQAR